ncbi:MAG: hypothetical protein AW09_001202 [Candidatus Accumulibacter phosphatis]|uniref:Uncharacterized protein n=1 Tax=Candidatus Accumulibacter phosphatis TaxID=327160 RepID=A0A080M8U0_9PROT|nr:MAG: hypothetical protein AW09_001202 [Candidatus Accumulibacter phosphatis]
MIHLWCLGTDLPEIEDDCAASELQAIGQIIEVTQEIPRLLGGVRHHKAVALRTFQVKPEQRRQIVVLDRAIGPINRFAMRIKVVRQDLLGLRNLLGNRRFELLIGCHVAKLRVAFHFHQSAGDHSAIWIKVEQRQVGATEADLIAKFHRVLAQSTVQLQMRIQRDNNLVQENALMFKEQARQRQAHRLCALRRRRKQLQCEAPGKRA